MGSYVWGEYMESQPRCGCWYSFQNLKTYLPLVETRTHVSVLSTAYQTTLEQSFTSSATTEMISRCIYEFPLYDGISITSFTCTIGAKTLHGVVHERSKATEKFDAAVARGEAAGLLEQDTQASDIFQTVLGNVPAGETVHVRITYVGELKQDAEVNGTRLVIPSIIAPRYGSHVRNLHQASYAVVQSQATSITVDINLAEGSPLQSIESPSHPISVSIGTTSTDPEAELTLTKGSASLSLQESSLDKDFVLLVKTKNIDVPKAILETHATLRDHRALMTTLVPRFDLPMIQPEVVFVADRSGSMRRNMRMLKQAMTVFLRSLPPGIKFNICSFGNDCDFLWDTSQPYAQESLHQATHLVQAFEANYGGTETLHALQATIGRRYADVPLEVILLTDGDIWQQDTALKWLGDEVKKSEDHIRVFPLGIGDRVSHSLIEGLARAGNGFAQAVQDGERMDNKVVRMLKGALSPHLSDFTLDVVFNEDDDFELVDKVGHNLTVRVNPNSNSEGHSTGSGSSEAYQAPISLFDPSTDPFTPPKDSISSEPELPDVPIPKILRAPSTIPHLYPFARTTAYLLLSPTLVQRDPEALILRAKSKYGPLELRIPVTVLDEAGTTVHCLAARKAAQDLEESRGWLHEAKDNKGELLSKTMPGKFQDMVQREAVRLGETFQVANRWCSSVAVEANSKEDAQADKKAIEDQRRDQGLIHHGDENLCRRKSCLPVQPSPMSRGGIPAVLAGRGGKMRRSRGPGGNAFFGAQAGAAPRGEARMATGFQMSQQQVSSPASSNSRAAFFPCEQYNFESSDLSLRRSDLRELASINYYPEAVEDTGEERAIRLPRLRRRMSPNPPGVYDRSPRQSAVADVLAPTTEASSHLNLDPATRTHRIIALQEFDGQWTASAELSTLLDLGSAGLEQYAVFTITYVVVSFLEEMMPQERNVWEMVVDKAKIWLQTQAKGTDPRVLEAQSVWAALKAHYTKIRELR